MLFFLSFGFQDIQNGLFWSKCVSVCHLTFLMPTTVGSVLCPGCGAHVRRAVLAGVLRRWRQSIPRTDVSYVIGRELGKFYFSYVCNKFKKEPGYSLTNVNLSRPCFYCHQLTKRLFANMFLTKSGVGRRSYL